MTKRKPRDPALAPTPDTRPNLLGDWLKANIVRDPQDGKFYLAPILDARLALLRAYKVDLEELEGLCLLPGMGKE